MSLLALLITETEEELAPLIMSPFAFAGIAVAFFVVVGFVNWSFRDVANRHSQKTGSAGHDSHGAGH
ncbi:hypothetical protein BH10ACT7_BH10ACT7_24570 [soil metagenome]